MRRSPYQSMRRSPTHAGSTAPGGDGVGPQYHAPAHDAPPSSGYRSSPTIRARDPATGHDIRIYVSKLVRTTGSRQAMTAPPGSAPRSSSGGETVVATNGGAQSPNNAAEGKPTPISTEGTSSGQAVPRSGSPTNTSGGNPQNSTTEPSAGDSTVPLPTICASFSKDPANGCTAGANCPFLHCPTEATWGTIDLPPFPPDGVKTYSAGWTMHAYDAGMNYYLEIPSEHVVSTVGAINFIYQFNENGIHVRNRFLVCRHYDEAKGLQSCVRGGNCNLIHCIKLPEAKKVGVHINYILDDPSTSRYPALKPGHTLLVFPPNNASGGEPEEFDSDFVLATCGSESYIKTVEETGLPPKTRMQHCAHYRLKNFCNRGSRCNFIHVLNVDPDAVPGEPDFNCTTGWPAQTPQQPEQQPPAAPPCHDVSTEQQRQQAPATRTSRPQALSLDSPQHARVAASSNEAEGDQLKRVASDLSLRSAEENNQAMQSRHGCPVHHGVTAFVDSSRHHHHHHHHHHQHQHQQGAGGSAKFGQAHGVWRERRGYGGGPHRGTHQRQHGGYAHHQHQHRQQQQQQQQHSNNNTMYHNEPYSQVNSTRFDAGPALMDSSSSSSPLMAAGSSPSTGMSQTSGASSVPVVVGHQAMQQQQQQQQPQQQQYFQQRQQPQLQQQQQQQQQHGAIQVVVNQQGQGIGYPPQMAQQPVAHGATYSYGLPQQHQQQQQGAAHGGSPPQYQVQQPMQQMTAQPQAQQVQQHVAGLLLQQGHGVSGGQMTLSTQGRLAHPPAHHQHQQQQQQQQYGATNGQQMTHSPGAGVQQMMQGYNVYSHNGIGQVQASTGHQQQSSFPQQQQDHAVYLYSSATAGGPQQQQYH